MRQLGFLAGALALALLISCGKKNETVQEAPAMEYPVMVVTAQDANMQSVYPVTIKGKEDIEIRPRIDGYIQEIFVDEGAVVHAGQALFKIDSPSSEQSLTSAQASVNSAQAQVNTARVNVERFRPLAEKGIVSNVQLQTYENAYASAVATLEQAKATLKNAEATMSWTRVTSPVEGVVGTIPFRKGSLVDKNNTLTTVANTSNVYAYFSLNEKKLMEFLAGVEGKTQSEKIKNMPEVSLLLADGSEYAEKGHIETITGTVDVTTGSASFRAEFPNKQGILRSGASGNIRIPQVIENVFIIPQKATFKQQDKVLVYKLGDDNVTDQQIVSVIGMPNGQDYAVTAGLSAGDKIVSDGVATLRHGTKIAIKNNTTAAK